MLSIGRTNRIVVITADAELPRIVAVNNTSILHVDCIAPVTVVVETFCIWKFGARGIFAWTNDARKSRAIARAWTLAIAIYIHSCTGSTAGIAVGLPVNSTDRSVVEGTETVIVAGTFSVACFLDLCTIQCTRIPVSFAVCATNRVILEGTDTTILTGTFSIAVLADSCAFEETRIIVCLAVYPTDWVVLFSADTAIVAGTFSIAVLLDIGTIQYTGIPIGFAVYPTNGIVFLSADTVGAGAFLNASCGSSSAPSAKVIVVVFSVLSTNRCI